MRPPSSLPKRIRTQSTIPIPARHLSLSSPTFFPPRNPTRFPLPSSSPPSSNSRQAPPYPPILTPFQKKILSIPKSDPNGGWTVDDPSSTRRASPKAGSSGGGGAGGGGGQGKVELTGRQKLVGVGLVGSGVYYVAHLERVPETGRLRFIDTSVESEQAMGLQSFQETLSQYQSLILPPNHPTSKFVRRIAERIVEANELGRIKGGGGGGGVKNILGGGWGGFGGEEDQGLRLGGEGKETEWEVFVIDDPKTKNAFVLPGGKIFVFSGLLPIVGGEDGLASVMGHEMAHQVARHSAERLSSLKVLWVLGVVLETLGLDIGISRILLNFLLSLPNSRKSESEADFIGLRLASKACFDPRESPKMWTRMSESDTTPGSSGLANIDFMSTHPANGKRIKNIEGWLPEALALRASSNCGDTPRQYEDFKDQFDLPSRSAWGGERLSSSRF